MISDSTVQKKLRSTKRYPFQSLSLISMDSCIVINCCFFILLERNGFFFLLSNGFRSREGQANQVSTEIYYVRVIDDQSDN